MKNYNLFYNNIITDGIEAWFGPFKLNVWQAACGHAGPACCVPVKLILVQEQQGHFARKQSLFNIVQVPSGGSVAFESGANGRLRLRCEQHREAEDEEVGEPISIAWQLVSSGVRVVQVRDRSPSRPKTEQPDRKKVVTERPSEQELDPDRYSQETS